MPDGFLAIAAICRPRGATCWVLQVGLSFKLICHSAVEPRVTGRTKLARRKRGSYSYHINQTTVTLTRHRWPPHPPGTSSASHCADCQTALRTRSGSPGRHRVKVRESGQARSTLCWDPGAAGPSVETDVYRLISHPLQDPSTLRGGLAIHKKIAGKCRRPFSDPPGDLIDRWEHRDGRGRAPRANGSDIPFSAIPPDLRRGKGVNKSYGTPYTWVPVRRDGFT